jgi:HAMP domain-containing protein
MKIQTQLTVVVAVVVAFVVALAGVVIVMRNDHQATDAVDQLLSDKASVVRTAAVRNGSLPTDGSYAVRLISAGKVVKQVGTTAQFPVPASDGFTNVAAAGSEWRSLSETLISGAQMQILVSLANVREQHTSNVLKVDLLVVLAALLSAAGVWFATGRVLRPFQRLIAAARSLRPGDRLPEVKAPREVAELSTTLNGMLDRVRAEPTTIREIPSPDISEMSGGRTPQPGGPQTEPLDLDGLDTTLRPQLEGLGVNLDALMDNPDMPATQRHLILALMADEHREMVAELDRLRARSEG